MATLTDRLTQHFDVGETPTISIKNPVGEVSILSGESNQITIEATKEARSSFPEYAQQGLEEISIASTQNGDSVRVVVSLGERPFHDLQRTVHLRVTVPARTNIEADVSAGRFSADGIFGALVTHVASGHARLRQVTLAEQSRLQVDAGKLELDGALVPGASLDVLVHAGQAALRLPVTTAAYLDASTHVGNIRVMGWPVPVTRRLVGASASGDLSGEPAGILAIKVDVGSVDLWAYDLSKN
ncbi:MAG TPA: hypothetical protein VFU69_05825 [Ktedonobacterales bacterium]|nr:hypothetical protein [Ktedonobacterales bacterium]